jgi:hypothetical protein
MGLGSPLKHSLHSFTPLRPVQVAGVQIQGVFLVNVNASLSVSSYLCLARHHVAYGQTKMEDEMHRTFVGAGV